MDIKNACPTKIEAGITHVTRWTPPLDAERVKSFIQQFKEDEYPHWMNEDIFKVLELAGFTRTTQCCLGKPTKICTDDRWRGNMQPLFKLIELEVRKKINQEIEDAFKPVGTDLE